MDKIILKNMAFFGYHGVLPEETKLGQKFFIDAVLKLDLSPAGKSDDLYKSVSYADVYSDIKGIVEGKPFKLLEALAEKISNVILEKYQLVVSLTVTVRKPEAPVPGVFDYMGVEIERSR